MLTAEMEMVWKKKKKSKYSEIKGVKWEIKKETAISLYLSTGKLDWTSLVVRVMGDDRVYVNDDHTFGIIRNYILSP